MAYGAFFSSLLGNVVDTYSSYSASKGNQALTDAEGQSSQYMAQLSERRLRNQVRQNIGTAVVNAGASGFTLDSESTQQAIDAIVRSGEMDAAIIRLRGDIGKWQADVKGMQYEHAANMSIAKGASDVGGTLLEIAEDKSAAARIKKENKVD